MCDYIILRHNLLGRRDVDERPVPRKSIPVASEIEDWTRLANNGDELAKRAILPDPDPIDIALLRERFVNEMKNRS